MSGQLGPIGHKFHCTTLLEVLAVTHDTHKRTLTKINKWDEISDFYIIHAFYLLSCLKRLKGFVLYLTICNGTEEEWAKRIPKILGFIAEMILMKARISKWVATEFFRQGEGMSMSMTPKFQQPQCRAQSGENGIWRNIISRAIAGHNLHNIILYLKSRVAHW